MNCLYARMHSLPRSAFCSVLSQDCSNIQCHGERNLSISCPTSSTWFIFHSSIYSLCTSAISVNKLIAFCCGLYHLSTLSYSFHWWVHLSTFTCWLVYSSIRVMLISTCIQYLLAFFIIWGKRAKINLSFIQDNQFQMITFKTLYVVCKSLGWNANKYSGYCIIYIIKHKLKALWH